MASGLVTSGQPGPGGHDYVACAAHAAEIRFAKEGNCFTGIGDPARLVQIADTLSARTDSSVGTYEWWYFDAHIDDGAKLVAVPTRPPNPRLSCLATGYLAWVVATVLLGDVRRNSPWLTRGNAG
jgi:hypothetical protein